MDFKDCAKFANEHPICSVATVDGDQPQLRMVGMWFADKDGFCFSTHTYKPFTDSSQNVRK